MKTMNKWIAATCVAAITLMTPLPSLATDGNSVTNDSSRAVLKSASAGMSYADDEVLEFLVLGLGPINDDNPGLAESFGFIAPPEDADLSVVRGLMEEYEASNLGVLSDVSSRLQSGDPIRVDKALALFAGSFNEFVNDQYALDSSAPNIQPYAGSNWMWHDTWLYAEITIAGAMNVLAFANAAGFHNALAVTVLLYVYLPELGGTSTAVERQNLVESFSTALSK